MAAPATTSTTATATASPTADTATLGEKRSPFPGVPSKESALDRGTDDRTLKPKSSAQRNRSKAPPQFRVDEAIATIENARSLTDAPVPRFILAREWVGHVHRWLKGLVTAEKLSAAFQVEVLRDPLLSLPVTDQLARLALNETAYLYQRLHDPLIRPLGSGAWERTLNSVRAARIPLLVLNSEFVSFELGEAAKLPSVATTIPNLTPAEGHVMAWLRKYRSAFERTETRFDIDRRGIAGAIAWEALFNVRTRSPRSAGPGKVHLWEVLKTPVAEEVEQRKILPPCSAEERRKILATPEGSILYIGAIMRGFATIARPAGYDLDCDPPTLANCYNAFNLINWERHMTRKAMSEPQTQRPTLKLGNAMGFWVRDHLAYLEDGVGVSARCRAAET